MILLSNLDKESIKNQIVKNFTVFMLMCHALQHKKIISCLYSPDFTISSKKIDCKSRIFKKLCDI